MAMAIIYTLFSFLLSFFYFDIVKRVNCFHWFRFVKEQGNSLWPYLTDTGQLIPAVHDCVMSKMSVKTKIYFTVCQK